MKLAIIPRVRTSALHVCLLSRLRERIEVRATRREKAKRKVAS